LRDPLLQRHAISVGPPYMEKLGLAGHLDVPLQNCWNNASEIKSKLDSMLKENLSKHPVIVYSCSLLAKFLVDTFYHKYGSQITQLDVGSCIDPWCGVISRPWHTELAKHYQLKAAQDPNHFYV